MFKFLKEFIFYNQFKLSSAIKDDVLRKNIKTRFHKTVQRLV